MSRSIRSRDRRANRGPSGPNRYSYGSTNQSITITDLISEGPIKGLVNGGQSIYLNDQAFFQGGASPYNVEVHKVVQNGSGSDEFQINTNNTPPVDYELLENTTPFLRIFKTWRTGGGIDSGSGTITVDSSEFTSNQVRLTVTHSISTTVGRFPSKSNATSTTYAETLEEIDGKAWGVFYTQKGTAIRFAIESYNSTTREMVLIFPPPSVPNEELEENIASIQINEMHEVESVTATVITVVTAPPGQLIGKFNFELGGYQVAGETSDKFTGKGFQFVTGNANNPLLSSVLGVGSSTINLPNANVSSLPRESARDVSSVKGAPPYNLDEIKTITATPASNASEIDKVQLLFTYPGGLYATNTENGDKFPAGAGYLLYGRFDRNDDGITDYSDWIPLGGNYTPDTTTNEDLNEGLIYGGEYNIQDGDRLIAHGGKFTSGVTFSHVIDLTQYQPFTSFQLGIRRVTNGEDITDTQSGRAHTWGRGGKSNLQWFGTDVDKWQAVQSGGISQILGIVNEKLNYPYSAIGNVNFRGKDFQDTPTRTYEVQGLLVKIPSNYTTREEAEPDADGNPKGPDELYDGIWDGEFKALKEYTNNPAWVFYDILTNNRYGVGNFVRAEDIDKWALYKIARYCDELVPNGKGGFEPRFTSNVYLAKATDVYKVLKDMATIFRGMLYWSDGKLFPVIDEKKYPIYNFNRANVIGGQFEYESTATNVRTNQVIVQWNNPESNYALEPLIVEDRQNIVQTGKIIQDEVNAFGCTSEGQAIRYGRWKLWTAINQTDIVSFQTSINGAFLAPGDIINVQDNHDYNLAYSGRIRSATTSSLSLDRVISASSGKITVLFPDNRVVLSQESATIGSTNYVAGDEIRVAIDEDGLSYSTLAATSISTYALINNAYDDSGNLVQLQYNEATAIRELEIASVSNSTVNLTDTLTSEEATKVVSQVFGIQDANQSEASYKEYKIVSIAKEEDSLYAITAVEYYAGKFDVIDYNFSIAQRDPIFPEPLETDTIPTPENVSVVITPDFTRPGEEVVFSWKKPADYLESVRYEISHNVAGYPSPLVQASTSREFAGIRQGIYTFRVTAIDSYGRRSDTVEREVYIEDTFEDTKSRLYGLIEGGYTTSRVFVDSANTELKFEGGSVSLLPFDGTPSDLYTFTTPALSYSALGANEVGYVVANLAESTLYLVKWLQDTALGLDYWYDVNVTEANRWTSIDTNTSFSSINGVPTLVTTSTSPTFSTLTLTNVLKLEDTIGSDSGDYGARVVNKASNSSIEISTSPVASSGTVVKPSGTLYRDSLNLDFSKDFLLGSIDGSGNWKSYLVLDPDLQPARSVLINSSKAVLEYTGSADNATQENTPSSIDVKVTAVGFTSPEFRIQTSSGLTYTPSVSFSASNGTDAFVYEFSTTDGVVAYNTGTAELITASVREAGAINNFNRGATFEITKTRSGNDGAQGDPGNTVVGVSAYSRSSAVITSNPGAVIVSLSSGQITTATLANGWSKTIPAGANPLYITTATASGQITPSSDTDTIAAGEWATPVVLAENGTNGDPGATARSVLIYQRTATNSAPANTPTGNTTYEIATNSALFTTANGWSTDISGTDPYLWVSQATALSASARDIIPDTEWAAIELLASDGEQGDPGLRTVAGNLYYEKSATPGTPPNAPTGTITYRFADGSVSSSTAGQIGTGLNIWTNEPRTQDPTSANVHYRLSYYGTEAAANSNTVTLSLASVTQFTEFTGVVAFSDLSAAGATEIHGANISTGQITLGSGDGLGHIKAGKTSYSSTAAGFYIGFDPEETNSSAALLHLGDATQNLKWTGSSLQVKGVIASDAIEVNPTGQLILGTGSTVEGDLQATTVVAGGVNVAALGQDVVNFIDSRVSSTVGSSFGGYYVRNLSTTAFANASDQDYLLNRDTDGNVVANVERGSGDITAKLVANKTWTSPLNRTYLSLSAEFLYKLDADSTWTSIGSRIPMSISSTYIDLFGEDLYVYTLTVNNEQTFTGLVEGSDYDWKLNVKVGNTGGSPLGLAGSSVVFEASVLEGAAGSISVSSSGTADNANTLDGLDSTAFLRSNANDTFDGGRTLTINGSLLSNSTVTLAGLVANSGSNAVMVNGSGQLSKRALGSNAFNSTSYLPTAGGTITGQLSTSSLVVSGPVQLTGLSSSTETLALMISSVGGNISTRSLGSNAFNSTSYLPLTGGTMTGNITFTDDQEGIVWTRNTDGAAIKFYNTGDGDTDSRLEYSTRDNGNEYHRWVHFTPSSTEHELMTLRYSNSAGNLVVTRDITANRNISGVDINASGTLSGSTLSVTADGTITGNLTITGDLDVNGTTTTIDSSSISVSAKTITVARNATGSAQADGAGLFVEGPDASILYQHSNSAFLINQDVDIYTSEAQGTMRVGRNDAEHLELDVVDSINKITAIQDADENGAHQFILNRQFGGTGESYFKIQNGGTTEVSITGSNGRVGLGITDPNYDLDVSGTTNTSSLYRLGGRTAVNYSTGEMFFGSSTGGDDLVLRTGSSGRAVTILSSNNNVGIGLTNPSLKLTVDAGTTNHVAQFISTDNNAHISVKDDTTTVFVSAENDVMSLGHNAGANANNLNVNTSGKVGIGTTAPAHRLTISASSDGDGTWTDGILIENTGSSSEAALSFTTPFSGTNRWITGINQGTHFDFAYGTAFQGSFTKMRLRTDGTVGIGTLSPAVSLQVGEAAQSNDYAIRTYYSDSSYAELRGYGLQFSRDTTYIRSTNSGTSSLIFGGSGSAGSAVQDYNTITLRPTNGTVFQKGNVTVNENLNVAGTITGDKFVTGSNNVTTETDILITDNGNIGATQDLNFIIDTDNNNTDNKFTFRKNGPGTTSSEELVRISESGRVGVNSTAPAAYMDVRSPNGSINSLRLGRADNASYWDFNHAGDDLRIYNGDGNGSDILFGVNSGGTVLENKVGIGHATPDKALVVSASGDTAEIVINDTTGSPTIRFRNGGNTNGSITANSSGNLQLSNSSKTIVLTNSQLSPTSAESGTTALGGSTARWAGLYTSGAINFGPEGNPNQTYIQYTRSSGGAVQTITLMQRHTELGAVSFGGDDGVIIGAGETRSTIVNNISSLASEQLHLGAEGPIYFYTSPDNWSSNWAARNEMSFNTAGQLSVPSVDITGELASASISSGEIIATTALRSDLVTGATYPSNSYIDFDDDAMPVGSNGTSMRSIASMAFIIDSNNNGNGDAFTWLKDNTVASTATQLMDLDNDGNLTLIGQLNATTKSFLINHPTKEGMKLRYGSLEGPENGVYVRGRATTNVIELPDYWTGLVDETTITVQLTANGRFQKLFVDRIENNKVYLKNASWFSNKVDCYYNVYGERKDVEKLKVEY